MKKVFLAISLGLIASTGLSQEIRTLFSNDSTGVRSYGSYGGPLIRATQINNDWGVVIGGKGGVIINRKFAFGGVGMGLASNNDFPGDDLNGNTNVPLKIDYGAGGLFFEYIHDVERPIHFSIPLHIMAGQVSVEKLSTGAEIEDSRIFIVEPGVNLEFNVSETFIPAINISYRQVFGSTINNVPEQDLSGVNIGFVFKFGSF